MDNELTEQDVYEAFGLALPSEERGEFPGSANGPSPTPPDGGATETSQDGASAEGESMEDAADDAETPTADEAPPAEESGTETGEKREQTVEERRANAARRRERERREAVDRAVAEERVRAQAEQQKAVDAVYQKLGYADEADYLAKQAQEQAEVRGRALKRLGLTREEGAALFGQPEPLPLTRQGGEFQPASANGTSPGNIADPTSGQASAHADPAPGQAGAPAADAAGQEAPFEGGPEALERQLAEIHKLDPSVKTLEDLNAKPWSQEMAAALNARQFGTDENRLVRAYKVFAQEDIINARLREARKAGRQEALNQQAGKEHLAPYSQRSGGGLPEVPRDSLQAYRQLMPGLSYEQYQQLYADAIKRTT